MLNQVKANTTVHDIEVVSNVTETCIERLRNRISFNPDIPRKIRTVLVGARGFMDETKQFDAEGLWSEEQLTYVEEA